MSKSSLWFLGGLISGSSPLFNTSQVTQKSNSKALLNKLHDFRCLHL